MIVRLGVLSDLLEDGSSVPSTHTQLLITVYQLQETRRPLLVSEVIPLSHTYKE